MNMAFSGALEMKKDAVAAKKTTRKGRGGPTIRDVARRAGVATTTVSRVINGAKYVRKNVRSTVLKAMKDLEYSPNTAARSLASTDGARIGLLYNNPSATYFSEFLFGALDESGRHGFQLAMEKCESGNPAAARDAIHKLMKGGLAGMILPAPVCESSALIKELTHAGISVVAVATGRYHGQTTSVHIDEFKAAYEMTSYLLSKGHRRIGFVKGHPDHTSSHQRERGFLEAMKDAEQSCDPAFIAQGYFTYRSGLDAAEKLLTLPKRPTAIFASNDDMAAAVMSVAHRKGLNVPRDLSIVGFDDTQMAAALWPALTTIHQPIAVIARKALDLIMREIQGRRAGTHIKPLDHVVPHTFIERESVAPPKTR
jgi:LacI family transcriptional regulator